MYRTQGIGRYAPGATTKPAPTAIPNPASTTATRTAPVRAMTSLFESGLGPKAPPPPPASTTFNRAPNATYVADQKPYVPPAVTYAPPPPPAYTPAPPTSSTPSTPDIPGITSAPAALPPTSTSSAATAFAPGAYAGGGPEGYGADWVKQPAVMPRYEDGEGFPIGKLGLALVAGAALLLGWRLLKRKK